MKKGIVVLIMQAKDHIYRKVWSATMYRITVICNKMQNNVLFAYHAKATFNIHRNIIF